MRDGTNRYSPVGGAGGYGLAPPQSRPGAPSMPPSPSTADRPRSDLLVMFGASGDLAKKKLFPAVYRLEKRGLLGVPVIGVALEDSTDDDLRNHARTAIVEDGEEWDQAAFDRLAANLRYVAGDYSEPATFEKLKALAGG